MKPGCADVEEAIWNSVRDEVELTDVELQHIEHCDSCRQALMEVEAGIAALGCLRACPPAPDCREQILSSITQTRPVEKRLRFVWVGAVALAALIGVGFYHLQPVARDKPTATAVVERRARQQSQVLNGLGAAGNRARRHNAEMAALPDRTIARSMIERPRRRIDVSAFPSLHGKAAARIKPAPPNSVQGQHRKQLVITERDNVDEVLVTCVSKAPEGKTVVEAVSVTWPPSSLGSESSYECTADDDAMQVETVETKPQTGRSIDVGIESSPVIEKPTRGTMTGHKKAVAA